MKELEQAYIIAMPGASVRGETMIRAGATPGSPEVWVILPAMYAPMKCSNRVDAEVHYCEVVDPKVVKVFASHADAWAWRRARNRWREATGKPGCWLTECIKKIYVKRTDTTAPRAA